KRLAAMQTLSQSSTLKDQLLDGLSLDPQPQIRLWVARLTGIRTGDRVRTRVPSNSYQKSVEDLASKGLGRLETLASDRDPSVRLAVATAVRQIVSSSLTIDTDINTDAPVGKVLAALIKSSGDAKDPLIPFMIWMAGEPGLAKDPKGGLKWLAENGAATMPLSGILARKSMRRICDTGESEKMDAAATFLAAIAGTEELAIAALDGLIEGQKGKPLRPTTDTKPLLEKLLASSNPQIKERAQQLGTIWGDAGAIEITLRTINDSNASVDERTKALQSAKQLKNDSAREAVLKLIAQENSEPLLIAGLQTLSALGGDKSAAEIVKNWKRFTPATRRAASEVLVSRWPWTEALLNAVQDKLIQPNEISAAQIRAIANYKDTNFNSRMEQLLGKYRESSADKLKLIKEKRKTVLNGDPNMEHGREIAKKTCFVCHKLHGEGADVGPDLTGVGRSTLDALLANVIDPNQIIGKGYELVEVELKDGRSVSGRLVEESDTQLKLIAAGPTENVVAKSDIESKRVSALSVMPEGLEQMPDNDFRDLVWFILSPPEEGALTPEKRKMLLGK
ncbi:MAG: putative rane-bound dehydrogenase domain protein, partial [Verrucomicrobiales bacterium]|nr:putative rane-bound dehydrogenase domain protein [Verrucomicrobiales bacterium]